MNAAFSSRSTEAFNKEFEARKLQALPSRLPLQLVSTHGQVQIHTATYRGSFSMVLSEALRSAGLGSRVLVVQFLKGGVNQGPENAVSLCGRLNWIRPSIEKCLPISTQSSKESLPDLTHQKAIKEVWETCKQSIEENLVDKIVLDEIGLAIANGFIKANELISTLKNRPSSIDVILTGPAIPPQIIEMADQITELRCS